MGETFQQIKAFLTPPSWDSWQALIWISVFSWTVSLLARSALIQMAIASCGWFFLVAGVHWVVHEQGLVLSPKLKFNVKKHLTLNGFFLGPWVTGALVCIFLQSLLGTPPSVLIVAWPPLSAAIAALPKFVLALGPVYGLPKPAVRQELIILMLSNVILSCWLQLYFTTQVWSREYPSLWANYSGRSLFEVPSSSTQQPSGRGAFILDQAVAMLNSKLSQLSWSQVEQQLLDLNQLLISIHNEITKQFPNSKENSLWSLEGQVLPNNEYTVQLFSVWQGPYINATGYYLTRTCRITRMVDVQAKTLSGSQRVKVDCGSIDGPINGQPRLNSSNL